MKTEEEIRQCLKETKGDRKVGHWSHIIRQLETIECTLMWVLGD